MITRQKSYLDNTDLFDLSNKLKADLKKIETSLATQKNDKKKPSLIQKITALLIISGFLLYLFQNTYPKKT